MSLSTRDKNISVHNLNQIVSLLRCAQVYAFCAKKYFCIFFVGEPVSEMFHLGPIISQCLIVVIANLSMIGVGLSMGWTSPVLVKLQDELNPALGTPITETEGSWIVSVNFLSGFITIFLVATSVDRIGRKSCLVVYALPKIACFSILLFANKVWMIMAARVLCGLSDGVVVVVVPMYASEIASTKIRGRLGVVMQIFSTIGIVIMFCVGPFLQYRALNGVILVAAIISALALTFIPESPYFLYRKGRIEESIKVLTALRGSTTLANEEIKSYETTKEREESMKFWEIVRTKSFLKALCIAVLVNIGSQLTGSSAVQQYLQTILISTGTTVSSDIASAIIGVLQLIASLCTIIIIDRVGRKPIIAICLSGVAAGLIGLGTFFKISDSDKGVVGFTNYLPLISLIMVIYFQSAGLGSVMWPLLAELFDGRARTIGLISGQTSGLVFLFLSVRFFPAITAFFGESTMYYIYSANTIILCMFVMFCVPETKGKSFAEIQDSLRSETRSEDKLCEA